MICKQCLQEKPDSSFYAMGASRSGRCKECTSMDKRMSRIYSTVELVPVAEWPEELLTYAEDMQALYNKGAKIDYAGSYLPSILERIGATDSTLMQDLSFEGLCEVVAALKRRVEALESYAKVDLIPTPKAETPDPNVADAQRRSNLIKQIYNDSTLESQFGPEEHSDIGDALLEGYQAIISTGILPGTTLRKIIAPFQEYQVRMTPEIIVFYQSWLKPGIEATIESDSYDENREAVEELLGMNFYELDWAGIPYFDE